MSNKKFLIIGNMNAITYKEIFPLIKENKMWLGVTMYGCQQSVFIVNADHQDTNVKERWCDGKMQYSTIVNTASWFTNLDHNKRHEEIDLYKHYNADEFPHYDNYDAINVDKVCEIPMDYDGIMGVPISFLGKYCPTQFEIKGIDRYVEDNPRYGHRFNLNGKEVYARILIKRVSK